MQYQRVLYVSTNLCEREGGREGKNIPRGHQNQKRKPTVVAMLGTWEAMAFRWEDKTHTRTHTHTKHTSSHHHRVNVDKEKGEMHMVGYLELEA